MILVLITSRNAGLPVAQWLPEQNGRLVAVTAVGAAVGEGFAEVVTVSDYSDDDAVLDTAGTAARRHRPRAILAPAEVGVGRAAQLRGEFSERYSRRTSADFLASWVVTDADGVSLSAKLRSTAAAVTAGFNWGKTFLENLR